MCGRAACPPRPVMTISKLSSLAMIAPARLAALFPGMLRFVPAGSGGGSGAPRGSTQPSLPYGIACGLVRRRFTLRELEPDAETFLRTLPGAGSALLAALATVHRQLKRMP